MKKSFVSYTQDEIRLGEEIARKYESGELRGWAGEHIATQEFNLLRSNFSTIPIQLKAKAAGRKRFLYQIIRSVLGKDLRNAPQLIGDCVAVSSRNTLETLTCSIKLLTNPNIIFKEIFSPYLYGVSRVIIGQGKINLNEDGSVGAWIVEAARRYGILFNNDPNVPQYSAEIATQFGRDLNLIKKYIATAQDNPLKKSAKVNSWADLVAGIVNGCPATIASNYGFNQQPNRYGFHEHEGQEWPHQMSVIGIDDEYDEPYALILNQWPTSFGRLFSFYDKNEELPFCTLRVRRTWIEKMIAQNDTYIWQDYIGDVDRIDEIDESLFKLI